MAMPFFVSTPAAAHLVRAPSGFDFPLRLPDPDARPHARLAVRRASLAPLVVALSSAFLSVWRRPSTSIDPSRAHASTAIAAADSVRAAPCPPPPAATAAAASPHHRILNRILCSACNGLGPAPCHSQKPIY